MHLQSRFVEFATISNRNSTSLKTLTNFFLVNWGAKPWTNFIIKTYPYHLALKKCTETSFFRTELASRSVQGDVTSSDRRNSPPKNNNFKWKEMEFKTWWKIFSFFSNDASISLSMLWVSRRKLYNPARKQIENKYLASVVMYPLTLPKEYFFLIKSRFMLTM